jgi:hypothetical protein
MSEFEQSQPAGRHERPADPAEPVAQPGGLPPPSANPYQDFWDDCWNQPPITELPPASQEPWDVSSRPMPDSAGPGHSAAAGSLMTASFTPYHPPARRSRRPWILGAAAAVLLLLFGGGGLVAYQMLNGGGVQPEQVVPASTIAIFKIDLNPSASQKINAARLLHRLPKLGGLTGSGDWRRQMFQVLAEDGSLPAGLSYGRDIEPWLGERAAIAVLPEPSGGTVQPLFVVQCTNDGKARAAFARFGRVSGIGFYRGYAVIAGTQPIADEAVAEAKEANLAGSPDYRADFGQLGGSGIAAGWADLAAVNALAGTVRPVGTPQTGRLAFTVRAAPDAMDLVGRVSGMASGHPVAGPALGGLPAGTAIAAGAGYDPASIEQSWRRYQDLLDQSGGLLGELQRPGAVGSLESMEQEYGLNLPADLMTVLGSGLVVSVAADGLSGGSSKFAVRTNANGAAAVRVLDRIRRTSQAHGLDFPLTYRASGNDFTLANDPNYLASLATGGQPTLSGLKSFKSALPEASGASIVAFVNIDAIVADLRGDPGNTDDLQALSAFGAAGLTVHITGGSASLHIRLLAH